MTNWTNPLQPHEASSANQSKRGLPPQAPAPNAPSSYQQTGGQVLLPLQQTTANLPPQSQTLLPPSQRNAPFSTPGTQQQPLTQVSLRKRYTREQIELYFHPAPDRGSRIAELMRQRQELMQRSTTMIVGAGVLAFLLFMTAVAGLSFFAFLALCGIIVLIYFIYQIHKTKLPPIDKQLNQERDRQKEETARYTRVGPPEPARFDEWIDEIAQEIYNNAPIRLHLRERQEYLKWQQERKNGIAPLHTPIPKQYGTDIYLEGHQPVNSKEEPRQLYRKVSGAGISRNMHYAIYEFTSLFITEDYIAIYSSNIDLRFPEVDDEDLEYGYHQHLSHLLFNVSTITLDLSPREGQAASQQPAPGQATPQQPAPKQAAPRKQESIVLRENALSLAFDSGHKIMRSVSTLRFGIKDDVVSNMDTIHRTLMHELIDHGKSMPKAMKEGNPL